MEPWRWSYQILHCELIFITCELWSNRGIGPTWWREYPNLNSIQTTSNNNETVTINHITPNHSSPHLSWNLNTLNSAWIGHVAAPYCPNTPSVPLHSSVTYSESQTRSGGDDVCKFNGGVWRRNRLVSAKGQKKKGQSITWWLIVIDKAF